MCVNFILIVLLISCSCLGQQATPLPATVQTDYLKKSRHQRTWATVLLCTGIPVLGSGYLLSATSDFGNSIRLLDERRSFTGVKLVGAAMLLGSITLYATAAKNNKRPFATSVSFKLESDPLIKKTSFFEPYPALAIVLRL
jgi:hypothetical protein